MHLFLQTEATDPPYSLQGHWLHLHWALRLTQISSVYLLDLGAELWQHPFTPAHGLVHGTTTVGLSPSRTRPVHPWGTELC